ncbi:MAG TPA: 3'-5' exonuclease [Chitinophagaceae bacterium]
MAPFITMPKNAFTAIDFETASGSRNSICQVGLVRVMGGKVVDQVNVLVRPPRNEYNSFNTQIHGITPSMTARALPFDKVWPALEHYVAGQHLVAHNMGFDQSCLQQTLVHYGIPVPTFTSHCTYRLYRKKLSLLCQQHGITLNHHDALSDALACAQLFWMHLNK